MTRILSKAIELTNRGKNWTRQDGSKAKILFINVSKQNQPFGNKHKSSMGYFITKKLRENLRLEKKDDDLEKMSFEESIVLIREKNKRTMFITII